MCLDIPEGNISEKISEKTLLTQKSLLTQDNENLENQPLTQTTIKTQKQFPKNNYKSKDENTWITNTSDSLSEDSTTHSESDGQKHKITKKILKPTKTSAQKQLTPSQRTSWMDANTRKQYLPQRGDRRKNWPKSGTPQNTKPKPTTLNNVETTPELAELALRLELNGLNLKDINREVGTLWDTMEDDRIHESRKELISKEGRQLQKKHQQWNHQDWEVLEVSTMESDLPMTPLKHNP